MGSGRPFLISANRVSSCFAKFCVPVHCVSSVLRVGQDIARGPKGAGFLPAQVPAT